MTRARAPRNTNAGAGTSTFRTCGASDEMAAFDQLPPVLRRALNYGPLELSAKQAQELVAQDVSPDYLAAAIIMAKIKE